MQGLLIFFGIVGLLWIVGKLGEPWRKYHERYLAPLEKELAGAEANRRNKQAARERAVANAELFSRDFRAEVRAFVKARDKAHADMKSLKEQKSRLHDDMDDVRSDLDGLHRSNSDFWRGSQKMSRRDLGRRDSLKSDRDDISSRISELKSDLDTIYHQQLRPAKEGITTAHDDKERLKRFRKEGLDEQHFRDEAESLAREIAEIGSSVGDLEAKILDLKKAYKDGRNARVSE